MRRVKVVNFRWKRLDNILFDTKVYNYKYTWSAILVGIKSWVFNRGGELITYEIHSCKVENI